MTLAGGERSGSGYFLAQLAINTCFGVVATVGLFFIGVPSPALWGITSALLRFVPYIGPVIAALLPAALAAAVDPGWSMVLWTLGLYVVSESITGQVIEPLIYGHSTGLSPAAVVIAAIFWTWLWGPIGLVLSTPLTLCLVVLGRHVDRLEFFDVMLGDRPALTPVENFYQRMLADDPDEAQHQAELMLKERSLTAYYDEVALKGLQLAANDVLRGALDPLKLERIRDNVQSLVDDLASHEDRDPHPADKAAAEAVARLQPSLSTRLGTALRHARSEFAATRAWRRLLLILTDGEPSDIDVRDSADLVTDARRAVLRLRQAGIDVYGVVLDPAGVGSASAIFGRGQAIVVNDLAGLPSRLSGLYFRLARR